MLHKFALAFKSKTYDHLFSEDPSPDTTTTTLDLLLDSTEEFIPDQKVVVLKPDPIPRSPKLHQSLLPSLFSSLSSFQASYLQFQAAHVPHIDPHVLQSADNSIVSILHKLNDIKKWYYDSGSGLRFEFPAASFLDFQVQENQSKLRALDTIMNSLQSQIDAKDDEVVALRKKLDHIRCLNAELSRKLGLRGEKPEVLLTIRVFEAMLGDSLKALRCFTKLLIELMTKAGWDLKEAAKSVCPGVVYGKKGHFRFVFLSYVCLGMFQGFDREDFGLCDGEVVCNGNGEGNGYLRRLVEHVASNPMEMLRKDPKCEFSRFCERKYDGMVHPTMESSIFRNLDRKDKVLDSWKSLTVFYESFVRMASSLWLLHKLAYSFCPVVEIFQVERGVEFSMVYMEDVLGKCSLVGGKARPRVGFTVVPGFKVGRTVIQSQVYLNSSSSGE